MPRRLFSPADPARSRVAEDYQHVPRLVTAMAKDFVHRDTTGPHSHPRGQLVYAIEGVMRVSTHDGFWTMPRQGALGGDREGVEEGKSGAVRVIIGGRGQR